MLGFDAISERIAAIAPLVVAHADEADANRHLSAPVAQAMARAGLYRVAAPEKVGGSEEHPVTQIKTIEAVSTLDGAAGWTLMIGIEGMGVLGATLPPDQAAQLFADPELIVSSALNPLGRAEAAGADVSVTGQWPFASGCHNAHFFWGQSLLTRNGEVVRDKNGVTLLETVIPRSKFEIVDTWQVSGLRGSGSHDVRVENVTVKPEFVTRLNSRPGNADGPLYRIPVYSRLAYNKVGVATGIARAAIDHFCRLATEKTPRGATNKLREREDAQLAVAEAELILGSARSFVFATVDELMDTVVRGDEPDRRLRAMVQLACSGACNAAVQAVDKVSSAAGASANFLSSPLERCVRDVRVVRQHIMVSPQWINGAGRVFLGLDSGNFLL